MAFLDITTLNSCNLLFLSYYQFLVYCVIYLFIYFNLLPISTLLWGGGGGGEVAGESEPPASRTLLSHFPYLYSTVDLLINEKVSHI